MLCRVQLPTLLKVFPLPPALLQFLLNVFLAMAAEFCTLLVYCYFKLLLTRLLWPLSGERIEILRGWHYFCCMDRPYDKSLILPSIESLLQTLSALSALLISFLPFDDANFPIFILSVQIFPVSWIRFWHRHNKILFHFLPKWLFMWVYYFCNYALNKIYFNQNI